MIKLLLKWGIRIYILFAIIFLVNYLIMDKEFVFKISQFVEYNNK